MRDLYVESIIICERNYASRNVRFLASRQLPLVARLARTSVGRFRAQRSGCIERNGLGMDMRLTAMQ